MRFFRFITAVVFLVTAVALSGCSGLTATVPSGPTPIAASGFSGSLYGGRQPISTATITLYQTGTTGYGMGASVLVTTTTDVNGKFNIASFTCASGTQVYLVSTGGNPGAGVNNAAVLMAGVTSCDNINTVHTVYIDEVTTIATVWALAPFMNTAGAGTNVGAPTTNQVGLANAFSDVLTLVNPSTGATPGSALPSGTSVPYKEINTLANILVGCINSANPPAGPTSPACSSIFTDATPAGGPAPSDTVAVALDIARNPGHNVSALTSDAGKLQAFTPALVGTPSDFTLTVTYTGSGITAPSSVAVDAAGNVWITNSTANTVTELTHAGLSLSGTGGYSAGSLRTPLAIALDTNGNAWIANSGNSTISELNSAGGSVMGSPFSGNGLASPNALAIDGFGNVWISNAAGTADSEFTSGGAPVASGSLPLYGQMTLGLSINPN